MNRELSINIFFLVIVNVLIKPFFIFGIDRQVQNLVPATDYGKYATLLSLTLVFMIVNDLGIQNYNTRQIAGQPNLLQKYFPYLLSLKLALALVYVLVLGIAALLLGYEHSYFQLLAMLALNQVLISFILFFRANIASLHLYRTDSILSVLDRLLMIGICLPLLALHIMTIHLFIIAQTLAYLITLLAALTILWKQGAPLQFRWKNHLALAIFKKSLPFALSIFLMFVYARLDTILLERLLPDGTQQVAIYAAAFRLLDAANMIGVLFTGILLPMFSKMLYEQQDTQPTLQYSYKLLLTGTLIVAIGVSFFSTPIMHLLYTHTQPHSGLLLALLIQVFVPMGIIHVFGTLITARGHMHTVNKLFAFAVVANILLNLLLIPRYMGIGAAISALITHWLIAIGQIALVSTWQRWTAHYWLVTARQILLFAAGVFVIHYLLKNHYTGSWWWAWASAGILSVIWSVATGMFHWRHLRLLIKNKL